MQYKLHSNPQTPASSYHHDPEPLATVERPSFSLFRLLEAYLTNHSTACLIARVLLATYTSPPSTHPSSIRVNMQYLSLATLLPSLPKLQCTMLSKASPHLKRYHSMPLAFPSPRSGTPLWCQNVLYVRPHLSDAADADLRPDKCQSEKAGSV